MRRGRVLILVGLVVLAIVVVVLVVVMMGGGDGGGGEDVAGGGEEGPRALPTPTPIPVTYVVVSTQELKRGLRIPRNAVDIVLWPVDSGVGDNAFILPEEMYADNIVTQEEADTFLDPRTNPDSPVGQVVRTRIVRWQPILTSMVVKDLSSTVAEDVGSETAAILPSGYTAVTVPIDILTGVGYAIADGDRVDVIVSFLFVDVDEDFQSIYPNRISIITITAEGGITVTGGSSGRFEAGSLLGSPIILNPIEDQRPRLVTQRTVQNALVVHIGEYPLGGDFVGMYEEAEEAPGEEAAAAEEEVPAEDEAATAEGEEAPPTPVPPRPSVVTLGVQPQEALTIVWAVEAQIPITLAIRSAQDRQAAYEPTQAVSLEFMVANYEIPRPPRLNYALEPRLTMVRSVNAMVQNNELVNFVDVTQGRATGGGAQEGQ